MLSMVAHGLYCKQIYSYNGMLESLSGASVDVSFISFDDVLEMVYQVILMLLSMQGMQ